MYQDTSFSSSIQTQH